MNSSFASEHQFDQKQLEKEIKPRNADGSPNLAGPITHYTLADIEIGNHHSDEKILITQLGPEQLILGLSWLDKHNPLIDWKERTVTINKIDTDEPSLPTYCSPWKSIFTKKSAERFPQSRPYDHAIDLKPNFIPKDCPIYSLTQKETVALDEFLEENLRKGYIRPSISPQASPLFFVPKKNGELRPCQDYRYINE